MMRDFADLRVLVACECSGTVRDAFLALGADARSVDLKPCERRSNRHIQGDARDYLDEGWHMLIVAHPPCTRLCNSGVRWLSVPPPGRSLDAMWQELREGADLFSAFWNAPILHKAVENPVMHRHAKELIRNFRPHTQSVQPWQFGTDPDGPDNESKRTCLWLDNLPPLVPTGTLDGTTARQSVFRAPPSATRAADRSRFFPGIAKAMATQWLPHALRGLEAVA